MAQSDSSDSTRKSSEGARLPSVVPEKVQQSRLENEQLASANEFFASLDPDKITAKKSAVSAAKPAKQSAKSGLAAQITELEKVKAGSAAKTKATAKQKTTAKVNAAAKLKAAAKAKAAARVATVEPSTPEVVAELDAPLEEIWDETLSEALGSELQQALPLPVVTKKAAPKKAIPMARRTRRSRIQILEREDEPFRWKDLFTRKGLKKNSSFLVSLLLHTLLLLFLSLLVVQGGIGDSTLFLGAAQAPAAPDEEMLEDIDVNPVEFDNMVVDVPIEDLQDEIFQQENAEKVSLEVDDFESDVVGALPNNQQAVGDGKSATFFGTKASGRRFVFVVDRSTSMQYGSNNFVSRELFNRYDVAKSELLHAIESLQPHQEFFVVMFAHNTMPMFGKRSVEETSETDFEMISATPENKHRFQQWVEEVRMGPGTDPRRALEIAIKMQPDAIFMLSDGCLLYTSPSPRDRQKSRMPSSA